MQAPSASELLAVWERARAQPIATQALMLLEAASPDATRENLARLSVGRRDARLLRLRQALFGSRLTGLTACPQCGQQLEIGIEAADIQLETERAAPESLTAKSGAYFARFRLPNSEDLAAVAESQASEESAAIDSLLSRCLIELRRNGRKQKIDTPQYLPAALIEAIAAEMERADPQASVLLALECADCGHCWVTSFDIGSFLWSEIDNWASRLLREVCALAEAFGWRETDILAMSHGRRHLYLQLIDERW